jgi:8-oxo-dGTP pyrophosphatase MutT (NUDIX family)
MKRPLSPIHHRAGFRLVEPEGGGNEGGDNPPAGGGPQGGGKPADEPKTFTQDDLTRVAAREKQQGKEAAQRELAEQLGVPLDEAKAIIQAARDAEAAKQTEAEKARAAADKERTDAAAEKQTAKQEVHTARLERAFLKQGVDLDELGEDKTKRLLGLVTVETGASYEDVLADVAQIKRDFPGLFGDADGAKGRRKAPGGDPAGNPPKPTGGEDKFAAGAEKAKLMYQQSAAEGNGLLARLPGFAGTK